MVGIALGPCQESGGLCTDSLGDAEFELPAAEDNIGGEEFLSSLQKYARQMYHFVASHGLPPRALRGAAVLEVGSGRGRGGAYIARAFEPSRYVGMDISKTNLEIATKHFGHIPNVRFIEGNAAAIPSKDAAYDFVINVESSHNYANFRQFVSEAYRVLKPGGRLLWADHILSGASPDSILNHFRKVGFVVHLWEGIEQHVVEALARGAEELSDNDLEVLCDDGHRADMDKVLPGIPLWEFWALPHSTVYEACRLGVVPYLHAVATKPTV
jgi:SAM-dependent methyltransferase